MAMGDKHPRLGPALGISQAEYDVIQARFENLQQREPGQARAAEGGRIVTTELSFQDAIHPPRFLFGAQLASEVGSASLLELSTPTMLAWGISPAIKRTFGCKTPLAFEEQFFAFTATKFTNWSDISSHRELPFS
jgi:hypothetical protein